MFKDLPEGQTHCTEQGTVFIMGREEIIQIAAKCGIVFEPNFGLTSTGNAQIEQFAAAIEARTKEIFSEKYNVLSQKYNDAADKIIELKKSVITHDEWYAKCNEVLTVEARTKEKCVGIAENEAEGSSARTRAKAIATSIRSML